MKLFVFPGNQSPEVRDLGREEVPYARTPAFGSLVLACHRRIATMAGAEDGEVISFTASGTGAAECLLAGWGPCWRRLLVLHAGTFGRRWWDMAHHFGLPADDISWEPHAEPPWAAIEQAIAGGHHDAVMAVHHETSTGELLDLARLGGLCRATGARLLIDAIGSFLADAFEMSDWGVHAALLSSQKGLCLPPGLAFLLTRPPLGPPASKSLSWYFDPKIHLDSFVRGQPPWSPAAQIYAQLDRRLSMLTGAGGAEYAQSKVRSNATAFRHALGRHGWLQAARHPSVCLTAIRFNASASRVVEDLASDGWFVLPSPNPSLIRVAHLGEASLADHEELASRLVHHAARHSLAPVRPSFCPTPAAVHS